MGYTHALHMGYSDVGPGVGMRHLEGLKNPDGLKTSIYVLVYEYKIHTSVYMGGGMRSWTTCFFSSTYFFSETEKTRMYVCVCVFVCVCVSV